MNMRLKCKSLTARFACTLESEAIHHLKLHRARNGAVGHERALAVPFCSPLSQHSKFFLVAVSSGMTGMAFVLRDSRPDIPRMSLAHCSRLSSVT